MAASNIRLGGSGLTVFTWRGSSTPAAYLQTIQDTAPTPVAQAVPVQSISDSVPSEIVTALAVGPGTLRLTFYEEFAQSVWQGLEGFKNARSLLEVLNTQIGFDEAIKCQKIIRKPLGTTLSDGTVTGTGDAIRTKTYMNCKIIDIDDGEQINIGSMVMPKGVTLMYTHYILS